MIYLITALDAEARPFIEHYRLKRDYALPYTLYRGNEILLLVTQPGKTNALMALSSLLGYAIPTENDILINAGICAAPVHYPIGEALLIHQIIDTNRRHYPDILYAHPWQESEILCVDAPQSELLDHPVDMESSAVFAAATKFFKLHQIAFLKIVSDHFDPSSVTKEGVIHLLENHRSTLDTLMHTLQSVNRSDPLFTPEEEKSLNQLIQHFTVAQGVKLNEAFTFFRLKHSKLDLPIPSEPIPDSKRERSRLLEELINSLTF